MLELFDVLHAECPFLACLTEGMHVPLDLLLGLQDPVAVSADCDEARFEICDLFPELQKPRELIEIPPFEHALLQVVL